MTEKNIPDVLFLRPKAKANKNLATVGAATSDFTDSASNCSVAFVESTEHQSEPVDSELPSFEESLPADVQRWLREKTHVSANLSVERLANQAPAQGEMAPGNDIPSGAIPNPHAQFLPRRKEKPNIASAKASPASQEIDQATIDNLFRKSQIETKTLPSIDDHFAQTVSTRLPNGIQPAWRVPKFQWPKVTDQLVKSNANVFADLVSRFEQATQQSNVLGVVGTRRGCGVSSLAYVATRVFAEALAMPKSSTVNRNAPAGSKLPGSTLLIDANLNCPMLASDLGLYTRSSWADLTGQVPSLADSTVCDLEGQIHVLPLNCAISESVNSAESMASSGRRSSVSYVVPIQGLEGLVARLEHVLAEATKHYQQVIVDLGAFELWNANGQFNRVAAMLQGALLIDASPSDRRRLSECYWKLSDGSVQQIVMIENCKP